jgi:outer membrane protein assembly factor BamB
MKRSVVGKLALLVLSGSLVLSGCTHSPIRNPFKTYKVALGPLPPLKEETKAHKVWYQKATRGSGDYVKLSPAISNDVVYQGDLQGTMVAIDRVSGKVLWRKLMDYPLSAGPVVMGDKLIVGTSSGKVVAFEKATGNKLWVTRVPSEVLAPPQGNQDVLLVNTIDGQLTALNTQTGAVLWHYERVIPALILRGGSSALVASNQALAGFSNGKFVSLDLKTGSVIWERTIAVPKGRSELHRMVDIDSNPVIMGSDVYVTTYQGNMAAINLYTGQVKWEHPMSSYRDIAAEDGVLYVTDSDCQVWAIDQRSGTTYWKQDGLQKRLITGPTSVGDYVIVGDYAGYVHWLRKTDGQLMGRYSVGKQIMQNPITDGENVYVTAVNGEITALNLQPAAKARELS